MPAATTHVEFARDVYYALPCEVRLSIHSMNLYFLGSQGPDFLFYHRFSALPGTLKPVGNQMHDEKQQEVIAFLHEYCERNPSLHDYYLGFLTHYCLDSTCHPLINAEAHRRHEETGTHEGAAHVRVEAELDVQVLKDHGRNADSYDVYKDLKVSDQEKKELGWMYHLLFLEVFRKEIDEKLIEGAVKDTPLMLRLLAPSKGKYRFAYNMENLMHQPHGVSGLMLVDTQDPSIMEDFRRLYQEALQKSLRVMQKYDPQEFTLNFVGE
ncbi:MAG: zinc dependent phospholipase C family protein [Bulleidia sp.]|nr:zinc dependent phospholipase C family protein [Bulleidia sp.]